MRRGEHQFMIYLMAFFWLNPNLIFGLLWTLIAVITLVKSIPEGNCISLECEVFACFSWYCSFLCFKCLCVTLFQLFHCIMLCELEEISYGKYRNIWNTEAGSSPLQDPFLFDCHFLGLAPLSIWNWHEHAWIESKCFALSWNDNDMFRTCRR